MLLQRQSTAVRKLNESWIFRVPPVLHDYNDTTAGGGGGGGGGHDLAFRDNTQTSFSPRVLSIGPLQAYLDRKLYYDSHLYTTVSDIKALAHRFILIDHPISSREFGLLLDSLPVGFDSFLQSFYSPHDLIQKYNIVHQKQKQGLQDPLDPSSPVTPPSCTPAPYPPPSSSAAVSSAAAAWRPADPLGKYRPGKLLDLRTLIVQDACFLAAFLKSLLHEAWPFLKLNKLRLPQPVIHRFQYLANKAFRSSKSNALHFDNHILSPHLVKAMMEDILLVQNQVPLIFVKTAAMIDVGCSDKDEAKELLQLYLGALAYRMLPFYRSKVHVFASIREIDIDSAPHILDVMYSLMVGSTIGRSSKGAEEAVVPVDVISGGGSAAGPRSALLGGREITAAEEDPQEELGDDPYTTMDSLPSVIQLVERGVGLRGSNGGGSVNVLRFWRGRLELPKIRVDDNTERLFKNLIAYESHSDRKKGAYHVLSYLHFMDLLIDTPADVEKLVEKGVVSVSTDSNQQVALMFNKLCRRSRCVFTPHYLRMARKLKDYSKSKWRRNWAEFYKSNLSRPWLVVSFLAAIALFVMTFVIMWYTVLLYRNEVGGPDATHSLAY